MAEFKINGCHADWSRKRKTSITECSQRRVLSVCRSVWKTSCWQDLSNQRSLWKPIRLPIYRCCKFDCKKAVGAFPSCPQRTWAERHSRTNELGWCFLWTQTIYYESAWRQKGHIPWRASMDGCSTLWFFIRAGVFLEWMGIRQKGHCFCGVRKQHFMDG